MFKNRKKYFSNLNTNKSQNKHAFSKFQQAGPSGGRGSGRLSGAVGVGAPTQKVNTFFLLSEQPLDMQIFDFARHVWATTLP